MDCACKTFLFNNVILFFKSSAKILKYMVVSDSWITQTNQDAMDTHVCMVCTYIATILPWHNVVLAHMSKIYDQLPDAHALHLIEGIRSRLESEYLVDHITWEW